MKKVIAIIAVAVALYIGINVAGNAAQSLADVQSKKAEALYYE